jgi:hypothetical protein
VPTERGLLQRAVAVVVDGVEVATTDEEQVRQRTAEGCDTHGEGDGMLMLMLMLLLMLMLMLMMSPADQLLRHRHVTTRRSLHERSTADVVPAVRLRRLQ